MTQPQSPDVGKIHAARIENSPRLQRTLQVLKDYQWHSTLDFILTAGICAVNSCIAELRHPVNGYRIECRRRKNVWEYRLTSNWSTAGHLRKLHTDAPPVVCRAMRRAVEDFAE